MCGKTAYDWKTIAMWRWRGGRSDTSRSPMRTVPPSIRSRPARHRSNVVLPQPDGPSRTMNSPSRMRRSMSLSATVLPKILRTDSNPTLAISSPSWSPKVEQVAPHEEDEKERRNDEEEPAGEHARGHDHDERQHHRGVDGDHGLQRVVEADPDERDRQRNRENRDREHL